MKSRLFAFMIIAVILSTITVSSQIPNQDLPDISLNFVNIPLENVEEEAIVLIFSITNNENVEFQNLRVVLYKGQSEGPPGSPVAFIELTSRDIPVLNSGETLTDTLEFTEDAGSYVLQLAVVYQNEQLPNTAIADSIEIFSAPVGDAKSILMSLGIIFGLLFAGVMLGPILRKLI